MPNPFCYLELTSENLDGAREFYSKLFEWKIDEMPGAQIPYYMVDTGSEPQGGMMAPPEPGIPTAWLMYVLVDDVAATCDKLKGLGGKVLKDKAPVPDMGWFAVVADPQGAVFGLWENKEK